MSTSQRKLIGLQIATGLVVLFVRHTLDPHHWGPWVGEAFWPWGVVSFLLAWFLHTIAVVALVAFAGFAIMQFHKFFLGYELEKWDFNSLGYYVMMTVLVAAVCILLVAAGSNVPTEDY
jgi:hypothetical protein